MTTTTNADAIIIIRNNGSRNEFSNVSRPAHIAVFTVDADDDEIDMREFTAHEGAKARDYAIKASQRHGVKLCGLADFDAGIWH